MTDPGHLRPLSSVRGWERAGSLGGFHGAWLASGKAQVRGGGRRNDRAAPALSEPPALRILPKLP